MIDKGSDLLELFENVTGVRFFRHSVWRRRRSLFANV